MEWRDYLHRVLTREKGRSLDERNGSFPGGIIMVNENVRVQRTKIIRRALAKEYGTKNVSVTAGKGTAASWVDVRVFIDRGENCDCRKGRNPWRCDVCGGKLREETDHIRRMAYLAIKKAGISFGQYLRDDGYNTMSDQVLFKVHFKEPK